jgi:methylthioribose-1-phosphate isomerase
MIPALQTPFQTSRIQPVALTNDGVRLLDQTRLPGEERYIQIATAPAMAEAIRTMIVRGAPAIGIAGAYGVVLSARNAAQSDSTFEGFQRRVLLEAEQLRDSRPTAVNLMWAVDRMLTVLRQSASMEGAVEQLTQAAILIHEQDLAANHQIGALGASLLPAGARVLTHCNAGALATSGYGTALGVVRTAYANDAAVRVYADETRPRLQGARLTTWELAQDGIPVTLITDGMSGSLMRAGQIDAVIVGADRIARNGDTANKIGTYNLALVAQAHGVPVYVAAPCSTVDLSLASGDGIPIEQREDQEIAFVNGERLCAEGISFYNPAFDVTPASLITAIITENGIARPAYEQSLPALVQQG